MEPPIFVEVTSPSPGCLAVSGVLTFDTASRAHQTGLKLIAASDSAAIEVNCEAVTDSDSAGLVVLVDWRAAAERSRKTLRFTHLPDVLRALAAISEVENLLIA